MSNPTTTPIDVLSDAMYELSLDERPLNAELLDEYARRFQSHANELTEFAIELAVERLRENCSSPVNREPSFAQLAPAVSRAVSRFQNRLYAHREGKSAASKSAAYGASQPFPNPFSGLSPQQYKQLVAGLQLNAIFVNKFRDRQIDPDSVPVAFLKELGGALPTPVSVEVMTNHLRAPQTTSSGQLFKSEQKPSVGARQTFEEAVKSSNLPDETQRRLLEL